MERSEPGVGAAKVLGLELRQGRVDGGRQGIGEERKVAAMGVLTSLLVSPGQR